MPYLLEVSGSVSSSVDISTISSGSVVLSYDVPGRIDEDYDEWFEDWDADGNETQITRVSLEKGEEVQVIARFTGPDQMPPGEVEVSLLASGVPPANAQSVKRVVILVPTIQDVEVMALDPSLTANADGVTRTMPITITNNGNAPERFDLTLSADWHIGAYLNTPVSEEIDPFGGQTTVMVLMPMENGLLPSFYPISVTARSRTDNTHMNSGQFTLEVPTTFVVDVEDKDMSGQQFTGGADPNTLNFEVFNHGNAMDAFNIELSMDNGVTASIVSGVSDGRTVYIERGTSTNVTISYAFEDSIADGTHRLTLIATSVESISAGSAVSESGEAEFDVGSLGWIRLESGLPIHITEAGTHEIPITIHNQHPEEQSIRLDVSLDSASVFAVDSVRVASIHREFALPSDAQRVVTIEVRVTNTNLANLAENTMTFNVTLEVEGDYDTDSITVAYSVDKYVESEEQGSEGSSDLLKSIAIWALGIIAILALVLVLVKIIMSTEHEDEISSFSRFSAFHICVTDKEANRSTTTKTSVLIYSPQLSQGWSPDSR